jgi:hypothetical protein
MRPISPANDEGRLDGADMTGSALSSIWAYWETVPGHRKPAHITLAHECLRQNCGQSMEVRVIGPEDIGDLDLDLHPNWRRLRHPAHRADYLRAALVYRHGGFWVDSDIIAFRSFEPLRGLLAEHDFVAWEYRSGTDGTQMTWRTPVGAFGARPRSPLLGAWLEGLHGALGGPEVADEKAWHALGRATMNPILERMVREGRLDYFPIVAEETVAPIKARQRKRFLSEEPIRTLIKPKEPLQPFVFYFNSWMPEVQKLSREDILTGTSVFCRLFQYAFYPERREALLAEGA